MRNDELDQLLKTLRLGKIREIIEDELGLAEKKQLAYNEFLLRLLRAEWHAKQESALHWRIKRADLPDEWTLESFPFKRQPGVSRRQMRGLASWHSVCQTVEAARPLLPEIIECATGHGPCFSKARMAVTHVTHVGKEGVER